MRICIVGAGAIGGMLAVRLAESGCEVSAVARGAQLAAIREKSLTLIEADGSELGPLTETPTPSIDAVLACVKLLGKN